MPNPNPSTSQRQPLSGIPEPLLQADTFQRSAANLATGGWSDNIAAAMDAWFDRSPGDWLTHYKAALQKQLARDAYDASHRTADVLSGDGLGLYIVTRGAARAGAERSAALPPVAKGQLGERLSVAKTILQGDRPVGFQLSKIMQNGKRTRIDHETAKGLYVESKFGPAAKLSPNQQYAQEQWGSGYRVDHWLPEHVGRITAPLGPAMSGLLSWGNHLLNAPHDEMHSGDASSDDPPRGDEDGGSQYSGWQDAPYPAIY
jgi:hypothetical protein